MRVLAVPLAAALLALSSAAADSRLVYRRSTPIDTRTGVVVLRTVDEPIVDIPADCTGAEPGTFGCAQERRFPRAYVLEFFLERRETRDGEKRTEIEERGRASLLLSLDPAERKGFDDELRAALATLSADAFAESFAGLGPTAGVFGGIARRSAEPSWSCFERGTSRQTGRYERQVEGGRVTGSGWTGFSEDEVTLPLCRAGAALASAPGAGADELRTTPAARALSETDVAVAFANGLRRDAYAEDLAPLPRDLVYTVTRTPGVKRSESVQTNDALVQASYTQDDVKVSASAAPAALATAPVATNAWVARWTVETAERTMGPLPGEVRLSGVELRIALLPTLPPVPVDSRGKPAAPEAKETYAVALDADAMLAEIGERLDDAAALDAAALEAAVADHPSGLGSQGWLLVVCRPDGSADYRLLPTKAVARVENADAFCAAVERQLSGAGID
jgi:hypothetical protein